MEPSDVLTPQEYPPGGARHGAQPAREVKIRGVGEQKRQSTHRLTLDVPHFHLGHERVEDVDLVVLGERLELRNAVQRVARLFPRRTDRDPLTRLQVVHQPPPLGLLRLLAPLLDPPIEQRPTLVARHRRRGPPRGMRRQRRRSVLERKAVVPFLDVELRRVELGVEHRKKLFLRDEKAKGGGVSDERRVGGVTSGWGNEWVG